ncbi:MAG TPA: porin, partial [Albitalea sp.]
LMYSGFRDPTPQGAQVRMANTIGYKSPSFGGLTVQAATSLGENVVGRTDGFNIEYGAGPIYAAFAFERVRGNGSNPAVGGSARDGDKLMNLAVHYDLGMVKPMLYYARAEVDATSRENDFWSIGALAPIGPGNLKAAYARYDDPARAEGLERSKFSVGYDYPFSKRTNLYLDFGQQRGDGLTTNRTWSFGAKHTF